MASDITLAVGDGARRMTYAELAAVRGISPASAKRLAQRHRWGRQVGNDGVTRVTVPLSALVNTVKEKSVTSDVSGDVAPIVVPVTASQAVQTKGKVVPGDTDEMSSATEVTGPVTPTDVTGDVAPTVIPVTEPLAHAVEALSGQLGIANRRIDELQRQIGGLYAELADARTAAMITGCEAAALRSRLEVLTERRPWWRRWFR